jgi:hypothetical protein
LLPENQVFQEQVTTESNKAGSLMRQKREQTRHAFDSTWPETTPARASSMLDFKEGCKFAEAPHLKARLANALAER